MTASDKLPLVVAVLMAVIGVARADDELLKSEPTPAPPPATEEPERETPKAKPPVAPSPGQAQQKGEPGMMGMSWPRTPEEADKTLSNLYAFLATIDDHRQAGEIGAAIERLWRLPGGDTVNLLIDRAELFSSRNELDKAMPLLNAAVELAPDYAEAWSHRAYIEFRANNYQAALGDLRRAVALEPNHFRALDGMAKILVQIGEKKAALKVYEQLLKVHPNIEGGKTAEQELRKQVEGQGI